MYMPYNNDKYPNHEEGVKCAGSSLSGPILLLQKCKTKQDAEDRAARGVNKSF